MNDLDPRLESLLGRLPDQVPFPPTPDIAARLGVTLPDRRSPRVRPVSPWLYAAVAIAAILLIMALPAPREAIADLLGLPGIRIELTGRHASDDPPTSIESTLLFGTQTTLNDAQEQVPFTILAPHGEGLPGPDEVWIRASGDISAVSLVYGASDTLPEIGETGVGMLLMQFQAIGEAPFLAKRASTTGPVTTVTVNGEGGFWIENGELVVLAPGLEDARRSGNVLLWEENGVTYRLESALEMATAIEIAESLQPIVEQERGNQRGTGVVGEVTTTRTLSRSTHHEPPPLPCRNHRRAARPSYCSRRCRRMGLHPAHGAPVTRDRR